MLQNNGLGVERSGPEATTADAAAAAATGLEEGSGEPGGVFGFQLRLVMEFCDKVSLLCWGTVWGLSGQSRRGLATLLLGVGGDDCCGKSGGNGFPSARLFPN
jgi:hypothetical protein